MDKKFLKESGLMESVKRFNQILEYTNAAGAFTIDEAGEEDMNDPNAGQMPQQDPSMGGEMPPMDGGDAPDGGQMPPMDGGAAPQGDGGQMPQMDDASDAAAPEGFAPQGGDEQMPPMEDGEEEEVIDVDELTDAQEETEDKIDKLSSKFEKLLSKIDSFESQIDASNEKIEALKTDIKAEIEKRNPTPVEKLSLRSKDSYPFNVTPEEYWKEKEATSNYSTEDDENGANDRVYQITKDEIDNFNDYANISKTFDDYDIRNMFGY